MKVEIIYHNEEAKRLSKLANKMASNVSKKLKPVAKEIKKENAIIVFHFGCKNFHVEVSASPSLQQSIYKLLDKQRVA